MTMTTIPDFDDGERWVIESTLKERYGRRVETHEADVELRLQPGDVDLASCPAMVWQERGAGFVIAKVGDSRYRPMFFYADNQQYGTGKLEYDDLLECATALLRVQADHEKMRDGVETGMTSEDLSPPDNVI